MYVCKYQRHLSISYIHVYLRERSTFLVHPTYCMVPPYGMPPCTHATSTITSRTACSTSTSTTYLYLKYYYHSGGHGGG